MWISIQAKRINLSPRMREKIDTHIRRVFERERQQIASAIVSVEPADFGGGLDAFQCEIKLWSSYLGLIKVTDIGPTIRTAVQQASLRARHAARRRLHKRRSHRRRLGRSRLGHWWPECAAE